MLRKNYGFEHCIKVDALADVAIPAYDWLTSSGHPIYQGANSNNGTNSVISLDAWLAFGITPSWYSSTSRVTVLHAAAPPANPGKLFMGVRIRSFTTYNGGDDVISICSQNGAAVTTILSFADVAALRPAGAVSEMYIETILDLVANTRDLWCNGVFVKSTSLTVNASAKAAILAGTYGYTYRQGIWVGPVTTQWYRDIYMSDDLPGDGMVGRLGPQKMIPTYLDLVSGPWVGDDGATDIKATLNALPPAAAQVVSPTNKTPLVASLAAAIPDGYKVNALSLTLSGKSLGDIPTNTKVEIKQGGATVTPAAVVTTKTLTYGQSLGTYALALDGGLWDANKIDQTTITITPDQ